MGRSLRFRIGTGSKVKMSGPSSRTTLSGVPIRASRFKFVLRIAGLTGRIDATIQGLKIDLTRGNLPPHSKPSTSRSIKDLSASSTLQAVEEKLEAFNHIEVHPEENGYTLLLRERDGSIVIEPLDDPDLQIQPASVDLRLGNEFVVYKLPHVPSIDTRDPESARDYTETVTIEDGDCFALHPGEFVLGTTMERVRIPDDLLAQVEGRSSIGRLAVVIHATAGIIDPGFEGQITLELSNLGRVAVKLYPGMRISQLIFQEMTSPAERPYGPERGSKYFGQKGPVASRIAHDFGAGQDEADE